jgi:hypothetical protein
VQEIVLFSCTSGQSLGCRQALIIQCIPGALSKKVKLSESEFDHLLTFSPEVLSMLEASPLLPHKSLNVVVLIEACGQLYVFLPSGKK